MATRSCTYCAAEVPRVAEPVLCPSCGNVSLPRKHSTATVADPVAEVERLLDDPDLDPDLRASLLHTLEEHEKAGEFPSRAQNERWTMGNTAKGALPEENEETLDSAEGGADGSMDSTTAASPGARAIIGSRKKDHLSLGESILWTGREGVIVGLVLAAFLAFSMSFLVIVHATFTPTAWSTSVFVILEVLAAFCYVAGRFLNRHSRIPNLEQAALFAGCVLLPLCAFASGLVLLCSRTPGLCTAAALSVTGLVLFRRLSRLLARPQGRVLQSIGTALLVGASLAPLSAALPPLGALILGATFLAGISFADRRPSKDRHEGLGSLCIVSVLLVLIMVAASTSLSKGAMFYGSPVAPVWAMLIAALALASTRLRDTLALVFLRSPAQERFLNPAFAGLAVLGFLVSLGDPISMLVTGSVAMVFLTRASLSSARPILYLPVLMIATAVYGWLPDPGSGGITTLHSLVTEKLEKWSLMPWWSAEAIYFLPCSTLLLLAFAWVRRRGLNLHATLVGAWAFPLALLIAGVEVFQLGRHWIAGAALAFVAAVFALSGLVAGLVSMVVIGCGGLLGALVAPLRSLGLTPIELLLVLSSVVFLELIAAAMAQGSFHRSPFVRRCAHRIVDLATLFVLVVLPWHLYQQRLLIPFIPAQIVAEFVLALVIYLLGAAWRRPEIGIVTALLLGRVALGSVRRIFPEIQGLDLAQAMAGASFVPVVLVILSRWNELQRSVIGRRSIGSVWAGLQVLAVQSVAIPCWYRVVEWPSEPIRTLCLFALGATAPLACAVLVARKLSRIRPVRVLSARSPAPSTSN